MFVGVLNVFRITELRQRIFFTFGLIFFCRLIAVIPLPGLDVVAVREFFDVEGVAVSGLLGMYNVYSGGALLQCSVGSLGIMPYISASIIIQLMTAVIPHLENLARKGDVGRQKLTQYTRYLTVVICAVQGIAMGAALQSGGYFGLPSDVVRIPGLGFILLTMLGLMAGSLLLMWVGEQMTERGIGNGVSLIITVNIVSSMPMAFATLIGKLKPVDGVAEIGIFKFMLLIALIFFVILSVVAATQAQQKIPVQFAKRMERRKMMQSGTQHLPLRVNYSGVMPIIFAFAILAIPLKILGYLPFQWAQAAANTFVGSGWYIFWFGLMIFFFSYFSVATQFNPIQIAESLIKQGGYIPGIRPGRPTAEFLDRTMTRLTLADATFLTAIVVIPIVLTSQLNIPWLNASFFWGISLPIIIGVLLNITRQIESHLLMRHYDRFLKKEKVHGE